MTISISKKQNWIYIFLLVLVSIASVIIYRNIEKKSLLYRTAEKKMNEKSYLDAIRLYQESIEEGNNNDIVKVRLAEAYIETNNFPKAIEYYRQYLEKHPDAVEIRLALARVLGWNGQMKESEEEYNKVLDNSDETKIGH